VNSLPNNISESHARAEALIAKERVEGISPEEREWVAAHLRGCEQCSASVEAMQRTLRSLVSLQFTAPRGLAARTQFRVRLRAQEMRSTRQPRWRLVYLMCGASWVAGAATAPYVWRGLEWLGHRAGVPDIVWKMGFGVWWAVPAIIAAAILFAESAGTQASRVDLNENL
jgi:anti-sigma factor RsiW